MYKLTRARAILEEHRIKTTTSVGNNGAVRSMKKATSLTASANSLHFLQSKSNEVLKTK